MWCSSLTCFPSQPPVAGTMQPCTADTILETGPFLLKIYRYSSTTGLCSKLTTIQSRLFYINLLRSCFLTHTLSEIRKWLLVPYTLHHCMQQSCCDLRLAVTSCHAPVHPMEHFPVPSTQHTSHHVQSSKNRLSIPRTRQYFPHAEETDFLNYTTDEHPRVSVPSYVCTYIIIHAPTHMNVLMFLQL